MSSIKDVAKLAGVGVGTVSRCLSGNGSVAINTREKVSRAILALDYRPNSMAQSLSSKKSNIIGLWVPSFSGSFHRKMLQTIERELRKCGKHIILANGEDAHSTQERIESIDYLINRDCDGILISCPEFSMLELAKIEARYPNVVFINRKIEGLEHNSFCVNHYLGGVLAARHLAELGHSKIAVVTGRLNAQDATLRHQGFLDELAKFGIKVDEQLIESGGYSFEQGALATKKIIDKEIDFSALFCGNDNSAMAAIATLHQHGIKVGEQVSVIGYDDIDIAAYTSPALTSINIPLEALTRNACQQLLNICYAGDLTVVNDFQPTLTVRASTQTILSNKEVYI